MARWAPDAAMRMERAALELFAEQGYSATTIPQITERAGLTTRTFYLHFVDKRDVLFLRERQFPEIVKTLLDSAPASLSPLDLVMFGFEAAVTGPFDQWREDLGVRRRIIRSDERLHERELLKSSALAEAIEQALIGHDIEERSAGVLAAFGVLLFDTALNDWLDGRDNSTLLETLRATRERLQRMLA